MRSHSWYVTKLRLLALQTLNLSAVPACALTSISAFLDLIASSRWPWGLFHPERWSLPEDIWQPGIHRGTDLEWPQCLFPHYFESKFLQIEDSATPGLGNFLAACNVLSLNWFFRDNYLRPSDCSRRQAEKGSRHIFIFRHILGLLSFLTWTHKNGKGKAGRKEKLLLRPELGASNANLYVENMHQALLWALSYFTLLHSSTEPLGWTLEFPFSMEKTEDHWGVMKFPRYQSKSPALSIFHSRLLSLNCQNINGLFPCLALTMM